jgi:hypothetical protein
MNEASLSNFNEKSMDSEADWLLLTVFAFSYARAAFLLLKEIDCLNHQHYPRDSSNRPIARCRGVLL